MGHPRLGSKSRVSGDIANDSAIKAVEPFLMVFLDPTGFPPGTLAWIAVRDGF